MKIKLEIINNGEVEVKEFSTIRMRAGVFTQDHYDLMCEFICEMYGNKFSVDDLLDGMDLEEIYPTFMDLNIEIGNKTMKKMENLIKK